MSLTIRHVRPAEYDRLGAVLLAAYNPLLRSELDDYRAEIADIPTRAAHCSVLVAVDGGDVLGGVTYIDHPTPFTEISGPREAEFRFLGVAPWAGGRGVGRALVEACLDRASKDGRERLMLLTTPWMKTAHHLYTSLGFRRAPWRDWHVYPGLLLVAFAKELP